ncbi:MAG: hypothetical protein IPK26_29980 [Planctomycetes bacterium]|nr:hypothetical protein [Planctomycetota bacterium]
MNSTRFTRSLLLAIASLPTTLAAQRLVAIDANGTLAVVDKATGALIPGANVIPAVGTTSGMARDLVSGTAWVISSTSDALYTLDLPSGNTALVGPFGDPAFVMHGLEWDGSSQTLFATSAHNGGLYRLDTTTGAATLIGLTSLPGFLNLAYDAADDVMFLTSSGTDALYTVDRATGAVTGVGPLSGPPSINGLAWDSDLDILWGVDNIQDQLFAIDQRTGRALSIGATAGNLLGLCYVPGGNASVVRHEHGCGNTTIVVTGTPRPGGVVHTRLGNAAGVPLIGLGLLPTNTPFCTCTIGHEWSASFFGNANMLAVPPGPAFVGVSFAVQGAAVFAPGGCADPMVNLTDTLVVTIG